MAKITKSAHAPSGDLLVTTAAGDFTVSDGGSYETTDKAILDNVGGNNFLVVELDKAETAPAEELKGDQNDPHVNPSADHLSSLASPEAVAAADANEKAIRDTVSPEIEVTPNPTVAEIQESFFDNVGINADPVAPTENAPVEEAPKAEEPPVEEAPKAEEPPVEPAPVVPAEPSGEEH
jgi:hypothetical protein